MRSLVFLVPEAFTVRARARSVVPIFSAPTRRCYCDLIQENQNDRLQILERLANDLGIKQLSDWYVVSRHEVRKRTGKALLKDKQSLYQLLASLYPDYEWDKSKFTDDVLTSRFWKGENAQKILDKAELKLGIQKPEDWYSVLLTDLEGMGFPISFRRMQLTELLQKRYPDHNWEKVFLLRGRYSQQKRLEKVVETLFEGYDTKTNVRKEANIVDPETGEYLELDIFIPSISLAFEFQERHHYVSPIYPSDPVAQVRARDKKKKELAAEKGITVIAVPCWWDFTPESLVATIKKERPELMFFVEGSQPIPNEPPLGFFDKQVKQVEDIGEPVLACFFTETPTNPSGWWMFEKYDGIRGFWNPLKKAFYSRNGNQFHSLPQEIIDAMPTDIFLDGEIWFGRNNLTEAMKVAQRTDPNQIDWDSFKYMVFDVPNHKGTYAERYDALANHLDKHPNKFIKLAEHVVCKDVPHLEQYFQDIIDQGGEGVILRDPTLPMEQGRSAGYLKHKKFRDAEARVISTAGTYQWECELPNGVRFVAPAGTSEFAKRWNPQPGDIVSFKHHGFLLASKKPKLPTLFRMRPDLKWDDVVFNWKEKVVTPPTAPPLRKKSTVKPRGYWRNPENQRAFFCEFAKDRGFDPFDPSKWLKIKKSDVSTKNPSIFQYYDTLETALRSAFPELEFKFPRRSKMFMHGYWP